MQRATWQDNAILKVVVAALAVGGVYLAYKAYDTNFKPPIRHARGPHRDFKLVRQADEGSLDAKDRPSPNVALSIWYQNSSDFEEELDPGQGVPPVASYQIIDSKGAKVPVRPGGAASGGLTRLDVPVGYGHAPDGPVLHVLLNGTEKWKTPLQPFPDAVRVLQPVTKDDPRLTVSLIHAPRRQSGAAGGGMMTAPPALNAKAAPPEIVPQLRIQLNRALGPDEHAFTQLLKTSYTALDGGRRVAEVEGQPADAPIDYDDGVQEAQVRVRIAKVTDTVSEVQIHGVAIELSFGQPVVMVKKDIVVPVGPNETLTVPAQGHALPRKQRLIDPTVLIVASLKSEARGRDVLSRFGTDYEYLSPKPEDLGLKLLHFGASLLQAKGAVGPPVAKSLDPIVIRVTNHHAVWADDFTVTVPVHR